MYIVLDILTTSGILALVVIGLWFVLGLMDIVNFATTGFMAIGAYTMLVVQNFWLALVVTLLASAIIGVIVELFVVRPLYKRPLDAIIATWGVALVITQVISLIWGANPQNVSGPLGGTNIFGYSADRLMMLVVAIVVFAAAGLTLRLTRIGLTIRTVMENAPLAAAAGVNTSQVRAATFVAGATLAGLVGALIAPMQSVTPSYGQTFLVTAFLAVLMSGRSLSGLIIACLIIGTVSTLFSAYAPSPIWGTAVVVIVGAIALRFFPGGLVWTRRR